MRFFSQEKKIQLTLDCGQKEIGSTRCHQCHMVYTVGDKEDIKAHKEYHQIKLFPTVRVRYHIIDIDKLLCSRWCRFLREFTIICN